MSTTAMFALGFLSCVVVLLVFYAVPLTYVSLWRVFRKANRPGWASVVPVYNWVVVLQIAGMPTWWIILLLIPIVNIIIMMMVNASFAEEFGKRGVFGALGLTFLPFVFYPILASPNTKYRNQDYVEQVPSRITRLGSPLVTLLVYCIIWSLLSVIAQLVFPSQQQLTDSNIRADMNIPVLKGWAVWLERIFRISIVGSAVVIWKYKKWGVYSFAGAYLAIFVTSVVNGMPIGLSLLPFLEPLLLVLFVRPVWHVFE
jgi:hypothetical protein